MSCCYTNHIFPWIMTLAHARQILFVRPIFPAEWNCPVTARKMFPIGRLPAFLTHGAWLLALRVELHYHVQ